MRRDEREKGYFRTIWTTDFRQNERGIQIDESTELFSLVVKSITDVSLAEVKRYFLLREDILKSEFCGDYEVIPDVQIVIDVVEYNEEER